MSFHFLTMDLFTRVAEPSSRKPRCRTLMKAEETGAAVGESGNSESNSEVSGAESAISTNLSLASGWENTNGNDHMKMQFIDFLGVGAS